MNAAQQYSGTAWWTVKKKNAEIKAEFNIFDM